MAPVVLTQGATGLDFKLNPGGSCIAGSASGPGQQCTVNVTFAPMYPGHRSGAVVLKSVTGAVLGSTQLIGNASGALAALIPGRIDTVAGNAAWIYDGDGGLAITSPLFLPTGIVVDSVGNIYISDSNNNRIRRVDGVTGNISTIAGTGSPGFSGDGGLATYAMVSTPAGLVIDGAGNIYFADTGNQAIRRIDAATGLISTVAGTLGVQGYTGDGKLAVNATLSLPQGLAFDAAQNLYIADSGNNVIRVISATTGVITTIAGTGIPGYGGDGGAATAAQLNSPWNVTIGSDGSIYIPDLKNNAVRKIGTNGKISTVTGTGYMGFAGDGGPAASAELASPASVVLDPAGNIYIADSGNNRIRKINATTQFIQTITGTDSEQFIGDTGPANLASIYGPYALDLDQAGNLFIADMFHNRIRRISANTVALRYDPIRVGNLSPPQAEVFENDGNANLTTAAPIFMNSALDPATTTCNTGTVLISDATCNLGIDFAPTVIGNPVQGTLTVNSDADNSPDVINLSGQVLSVNPTSVTLTSSVNPSLLGAQVIFAAVVSSASTSLTGTMVFLNGSTQICSVALATNGAATCTTSSLPLGQNSITASYSGDSDDAASISKALIQLVKQPSTLGLTATPNPAVVTSTVTLTATATAPTGTPTGTVTFYDGTTAIGSANLNAVGVATFTTTQLTAATHGLSSQYAGDTTNASAQSNTVSEVIQPANTVTTLTTSNATVNVGIPITLTASVTSTNGPLPTGTVQFTEGKTALGAAALGNNQIASLVLSNLAPGVHTIVATYSGNTDNATSTSIALTETILQLPTTTTIVSSTNPTNVGVTVAFTATVIPAAGATADGEITGTVTFTDGGVTIGTAAVGANGQATFATSSLSAVTHVIVANYAGNTNYASSSSASLSEVVQTTSTITSLSASSSAILAGKPVTLTVAVTSTTGIATGTVSIRDGSASIAQVQLSAQGTATFTTSSLAVGTHTLTAAYAGDGNYLTSTSSSLQEIVSLGTTTLTLAGPGAPIDAGTALTVSATLTTNGVAPTGSLTLSDGTAVIGTQTVTATGSFTFSGAVLSVGTHYLTAYYSGDTDNASAVSAIITVVVQQAPTAASLSSSTNPSTIGQSITLSASVTSISPNISGYVLFEDGTTVLGSVSLANGAASFTTSTLAFGPHTLTAVYSGDTNHAASTSALVIEHIVEPATATLISSVNPSISGVDVVFTAKIAGVNNLVPTGGVVFKDGATTLGTASLDITGTAVFQTATLAVGSHSLSVSYTGDTNYSAAAAILIQTVQNANTQIGLTANANPSIYQTALELLATVTTDGGMATGSMTFTDGGIPIGTAVLNANSAATLSISTLAPGAHTIVANYAGDGKASPSTSTPLVVVVKQLTSMALSSNANPSLTLSPVTFTVAVTNSGVGIPSGNVTFTDVATQLGVTALDATGHASFSVASLAAGNHAIQASYVGDSTNFASTASLTQGVQLRPTTTTLTSTSTNPGNPQEVTLISVTESNGPVAPAGTVTFTSGGTAIGSSPIGSTGVATLTVDLQTGATSFIASYSGDVSYAPSASIATTITGGVATQFTMSISPPKMTLQSRQRNTVTLTLTSLQGFTDTLQLGCLGLPYAATCTFAAPQMKLAANGTGTMQIVVDTGDPLGAGAQASNRGLYATNVMTCLLPGAFFMGLAFFRKRRTLLLPLLLFACITTAMLGISGCGGLQINGTPPGTYTFKVSASGQNTGVTETQVFTLTVTP